MNEGVPAAATLIGFWRDLGDRSSMKPDFVRRRLAAAFMAAPALSLAPSLTGAVGGPPAGGSYGSCSQSQAFFVRAGANIAAAPKNHVPTIATWQAAVDALICGQVKAGTWSAKDIEYFFSAPSLALMEMNLVSSNYTLAPHGTIIADINVGVTGDGKTGYFDTGYAPTAGQMTATSAALSVCVLNARTGRWPSQPYAADIGSQAPSSSMTIAPMNSPRATNFWTDVGTGGLAVASPIASTQGGYAVSRTDADRDHFYGYFNGVQQGSATASTGTLPTYNFFLLANNVSGAMSTPTTDTLGVVSAGAGETAAQISSDHALFSAALQVMGIFSGC